MNRASRSLLWIAIAAVVIVGPRVKAADSVVAYTVVDLGDFGGGISHGYDINSLGQVTGRAYDEGLLYWAFLYSNGVMSNLGAPHAANSSGVSSAGYAINSLGQVAGMFLYCPFGACQPVQHPFLYDSGSIVDIGTGLPGVGTAINESGQVTGSLNVTGGAHVFLRSNGTTTDLGSLPGLPSATTTAMNNLGQIVGFAFTTAPHFAQHGFLYSAGAMIDVTPVGLGGAAMAINDAGQVTGFSTTTTGATHPFIYQNGVMTDLGNLDGDFFSIAQGSAINLSGQVAGVATWIRSGGLFPSDTQHAFLYSAGTLSDLGTLGGSSSWPGNEYTTHAINASGQVVGTSYITGDFGTHAFLYSDGVLKDLNALIPDDSGWTLQVANAINDSGQITGYGLINGQTHAYLLTPTTPTTPPSTLQTISVTPINPSISIGTTRAFTATGSYLDGSTKDLTNAVTWVSSQSSVASITGTGVATGVGVGFTTITATSDGVTGSSHLTVTLGQTTTTLTSSANPATVGTDVILSARITGFNPTGKVRFFDGTALLGTADVDMTSGVATFTASNLQPGVHNLTASYLGDINNAPSNSSPALTQEIKKAQPTLGLTSSPNPSVRTQAVTLTATMTGFHLQLGVTFIDVTGGGSVTLGASPLNNGVATLQLTTLAAGAHTIIASYVGDPNNLPVTSAPLTQTVTLNDTTTTLTASPNPSKVGDIVNLTATIAGLAPTGSVTFTVDDGALVIGPVSVSMSRATTQLIGLSAGTHLITASYSGDPNNNPSGSKLAQVVNTGAGKAPTTIKLTVSTNTVSIGEDVVLTATVKGASPTGIVRFDDNNTTVASVPLDANGVATLRLTLTKWGAHQFSATYSGDGSNLPSSSPKEKIQVN